MSIGRRIKPWLIQLLISPKLREARRGWFAFKRRLFPSLHTVTYYHRVDDPYSLLLLQALPRFLEDFNVQLNIRFVLDLPPEAHPYPDWEQQYALQDAPRLAALYGLVFPKTTTPPSREDALKATAVLLKHRSRPKLLHLVAEVTNSLWGCSTTTFQSAVKRYGALSNSETQHQVRQACSELAARGHYNSAMLYYGGEWYWGLDRLNHLADRLNKPGIRRLSGDIADYQRQYHHVFQSYKSLRPRPKQVKPLDFYFSFRSPYSYLATERIFKLAELYKIPVFPKPVMPMVDRGIVLSKAKRNYIVTDAKREAEKHNLPFGQICDPLGDGVDIAMALFSYAQQLGKEKEFMISVLSGIWAEGLDLTHNPHLKKMVTRADMSWPDAQAQLNKDQWRQAAARNRDALNRLGLWGVPTFKYGSLVLWGQDRLWALEQAVLAGNTIDN